MCVGLSTSDCRTWRASYESSVYLLIKIHELDCCVCGVLQVLYCFLDRSRCCTRIAVIQIAFCSGKGILLVDHCKLLEAPIVHPCVFSAGYYCNTRMDPKDFKKELSVVRGVTLDVLYLAVLQVRISLYHPECPTCSSDRAVTIT